MQHPCPYLFVSLSEIASCSAYGNKLFQMKLSPRTKEFLWLSALESWASQKMIHYGAEVGLKTCFCFLAEKGEICGLVDSCYQPCSWAGQVSSWFLADLSWWGIASRDQIAEGLPVSAAHLTWLMQVWGQRPPAGRYPVVVMPVVHLLAFSGISLKTLFVHTVMSGFQLSTVAAKTAARQTRFI